jgi:preprotein translocase subunit SecG
MDNQRRKQRKSFYQRLDWLDKMIILAVVFFLVSLCLGYIENM